MVKEKTGQHHTLNSEDHILTDFHNNTIWPN